MNQERGRKPVILMVDDNPVNLAEMFDVLSEVGYEVRLAENGQSALEQAEHARPDLILLDVLMPDIDGFALCRMLKERPDSQAIPILFMTALTDTADKVQGLQLGAVDYITKPFQHEEVLARVATHLTLQNLRTKLEENNERIKALHDKVQLQAAKLAEWNKTLEQRVQEQVAQINKLGRLKNFFSPQLAELIIAAGAEDLLKNHRREVTVAFTDLRGSTSFAETEEPEEVMGVLCQYHAEMSRLVLKHGGTVDHFAGDGMMVFFNDPLEVSNPEERAVQMALDMRDQATKLRAGWLKRGYQLGFGVGIASGYATIGTVGFEGRWHYAVIGTVSNLAARLCAEAMHDQILVSHRLFGKVDSVFAAEPVGELTLKGFHRPVAAYNILRLKE